MSDNIIIVGAPRSGTNMLRDVLTGLPGMASWPCDEINLLWKHLNREFPSDELTPAHATPKVRAYIRKQFDRIRWKYGAQTVVEKTCATSLRVGFTAEIFPDARYLFIRRDGLDAAASAMRRWDASFDLGYVMKKLRYAPITDLPFYGGQFVSKRLASRRAQRDTANDTAHARKVESWWGPKPNDFRQLQEQHDLDELALLQWQRCVESSLADFSKLASDQMLEIVYEDFVSNPSTELERILAFLGKSSLMTDAAVSMVSSGNVGKGRAALGGDAVARLTALGAPTLAKLGYV